VAVVVPTLKVRLGFSQGCAQALALLQPLLELKTPTGTVS
jgi:hypothetical protein